ncbi:LysM domain-containing protein [Parabacteroides sp. PF5-9]|uniref:LysM peptidoglycan-binding domain-containing protein n=1 Tax=Parabacteroides sp. PF5-9 TaxID=1742404 RepID=UPI002476322D|nr:LysM domain-containing protein [Parabacteroides sp. PF5-9]MDH6358780.1 LysM repeat protein [Parabacteroides sp. PF5-9]
MNKSFIYALLFILHFFCLPLFSQVVNRQTITTNEQVSDIFYHTIEPGQTVYAIATMYGVGVEDIHRLNPESREGIRAGATLKIPQRDVAVAPIDAHDDGYTYHTIQPKETLYSLSVRYTIPATDIMEANPGLSVETFTIGKTIRIPATRIETLPTTEIQTVTKEIDYKIQRKETMYSICRKFNISSNELIALNPQLRSGLKTGMVIRIPVQTEETVTTEPVPLQEGEVNALLTEPKRIKKVDRLRVALLLPFMVNDLVPSANTARFIEYYEGLLLSIDSLRSLGSSIELSVFDIGNDTRKLNETLREEAVLNAHLIIGAVQSEQIKPVADFAQKHDIKYIIPFTSRNDDVLSNASVYQVNTPHSYLYSNAAFAGCNLFANDNIIIVNIMDKEEKMDFIKTFKSEMLNQNIPFKELVYKSETFAMDIQQLLLPDKRNIVLPTSASLEALNKIKAPLRTLTEPSVIEERIGYTIHLFGYPEWQTYTRDCLEDFFALNTYIYSNFYAENLSPDVQRFYVKYKNWYSKNLINTYPKYGILGFDTGMFFLDAMRKYGLDFENHLGQIRYKGLQTNFNFERVNNWGGFINTNIFIVQYRNDYTITRSEIKK